VYVNDEKNDRKRIEQALMIKERNSRHFGYLESKKVYWKSYQYSTIGPLLVYCWSAIMRLL